jgi:hypothetical protein
MTEMVDKTVILSLEAIRDTGAEWSGWKNCPLFVPALPVPIAGSGVVRGLALSTQVKKPYI